MPPPASHIVNAFGWWSRPSAIAPSTIGVRPNSPPQITSVSSSSPRCLRSVISAAQAWSVSQAVLLDVLRQLAVLIPSFVKDLHEPHAPLDQPPREQAGVGERRLARLGAVQLEDVLRLAADVDRLGRARLHAVGHLERIDPRGNLGIADRVEMLLD